MYRIEELYEAAARAGLLVEIDLDRHQLFVELRAPDDTVLDGLALSTDHAIRYPASWLPDLAAGQSLRIGGVPYRVRDVRSVGDGSERRALLTRL
ncbi:hypothetical protein OOT46_23165 [Aquabacterium sp. A7-Y]|nr:hypothetical protein [Aquabacterium sp. A7-Y]MCW7540723.1 hypothetical protein [Aquabacterium sp. A7-Y]